jgi:glycosyltransferase involved in cell wall biosynthesis
VVLHYSGYARGIDRALESGSPSLLVFHNITPPRYFWNHEPVDAVRCELAYAQLAELAGRFTALVGVSHYNAEQLSVLAAGPAEVIPVLFDRSRLGPAGDGGARRPGSVLFVGRLVPHKRQDLVIRAFARFRQTNQEARLTLVGTPLSPAYQQALGELAQRLAPGAVSFEASLSPAELADRYRQASVFLCLSEHEGFCIPLLESFHFGLPVAARDAGAVGEVVGDAGVLLGEQDDAGTVAELLRIIDADAELRDELRARGERRLEVYDRERVAGQLRARLEELAA